MGGVTAFPSGRQLSPCAHGRGGRFNHRLASTWGFHRLRCVRVTGFTQDVGAHTKSFFFFSAFLERRMKHLLCVNLYITHHQSALINLRFSHEGV